MERIFGIGVDQVDIERIMKACEKKSFLEKYFSIEEQVLIDKRKTRAAANFAGKEAVVKAFGTGFSGICPEEVEILRNEMGAPYVKLTGNARKIAQEFNISRIHISLTDTRTIAAAYAIAVCEETK